MFVRGFYGFHFRNGFCRGSIKVLRGVRHPESKRAVAPLKEHLKGTL